MQSHNKQYPTPLIVVGPPGNLWDSMPRHLDKSIWTELRR